MLAKASCILNSDLVCTYRAANIVAADGQTRPALVGDRLPPYASYKHS